MNAEDSTYEGNNPVQTIVDWTVGVGSSLFTGDNIYETAGVFLPEFLPFEQWKLLIAAFDFLYDNLLVERAW